MHSITQNDAIEMSEHMTTSWDCAREHIKKANRSRTSNMINMLEILADCICVYTPACREGEAIHLPAGEGEAIHLPAGEGEAYKFSKPFKGSFRIIHHFMTMESSY